MSREVRMVPADWKHPKDSGRQYRPLINGRYEDALKEFEEVELPEWLEGRDLWYIEGKVKHWNGDLQSVEDAIAECRRDGLRVPDNPTYEGWWSFRPTKPRRYWYMPDWPEEQRTHYMMYETTSEGTPISPAFATPEELARWLADTGASAFADQTASYEAWLVTIRRGSSLISAAGYIGGELVSGVEFTAA